MFRTLLYLLISVSALSIVTGADQYIAEQILPQIGQRGSKVTCRIYGYRLDTAEEILFYRSGIKCTAIRPLEEIPDAQFSRGKPVSVEPGRAIELEFQIAKDAPLGEYYLRLRTREKLSELLSFWVTPYPVVFEKAPYKDRDGERNDSPEYAQEILINSTVVGYGSTNELANDIDCYKVKLNKGQRCTCQILNARLGTIHYGGLTDMALEVRSPSGKRVARGSRSPLFAHDPVVSFLAPEAGEYLVTAKQQKDVEGHSFHYGLHIGEFARPTITYPLGGQAGSKQLLEVFYLNGTKGELNAHLPAKVGLFDKSMVDLTSVSDTPEIPSPNKLQVAAFPNVMEDSQAGIQIVSQPLPLAINGIITKEGEKDWYRFSAKKGQKYRVRTYAMTLGSKLDPFLWIKPAEGTSSQIDIKQDDSFWDGHDWEGHHYRHQVRDRLDPIVMFEPDVDGEYLLGIGDTRREFGEDYIYRVEIQPHQDSLFTYYQDYPSQASIVRDSIQIHRGSSSARPLAVMNGFGSSFDGPIKLVARGLPSHIKFKSPVFTKSDPIIETVFQVDKNAKLEAGIFELIPTPIDEVSKLIGSFAQTHASNDQRGGYAPVFNKTRYLAYGILEAAPFDIKIEQPKIGLAKNAELDLKVTVTRNGDFKGAIYLESTWLPQGVTKQPPLIIPADQTVAYYKLSATNQAAVGNYRITITGRQNEGGNPRTGVGYHYVCAPLIDVTIQDPYLEVSLERASFEQGQTGELKGRIKFLREFSGTASANLLRLPTGVSLIKSPSISYGDESVVFRLKIDPGTLTGQYKEIACDIAIIDAGQTIHQQSGSGVIRIDHKKGS